jgi:hypothetical protein
MASAPVTNTTTELPLPTAQTLVQAARLAQQLDRPIQLDYYADTYYKRAFIGEDEHTKEKMLIKNEDEFTSLIQKLYKVQTDMIVLTENSLYVISLNVDKKRIQSGNYLNRE